MGFFRSKNKIDKTNKSLWYSLEVNFKNLNGDEFEKIIQEKIINQVPSNDLYSYFLFFSIPTF